VWSLDVSAHTRVADSHNILHTDMPSMERLLELRAAAFADDVEVHAAMLSWDEQRLSTYFESGGKASAPPPPQRSLRVLSLHGGGGNRNVNAMQVSRLRRALGPPDVVHFDFLEGDHAWKSENIDPRLVQLFGPGPYWGWYGVENASGHGQNDRDAYVKAMMDPAVGFEYIGYEAALDRLERHISEHGPYDALVGFSQGAIMVTMLTARALQRVARGEGAPPAWACNVLLSALPPRASPYATVAPRWRATREFPVSACRGCAIGAHLPAGRFAAARLASDRAAARHRVHGEAGPVRAIRAAGPRLHLWRAGVVRARRRARDSKGGRGEQRGGGSHLACRRGAPEFTGVTVWHSRPPQT